MSDQTSRGAHRAPRTARRHWFKRSRPACGPLPEPAGTALGEPYLEVVVTDTGTARIGHWEPAVWVPRSGEVVEVADACSVHFGRTGLVEAVTGRVLPVVVQIPGVGTVYFEEYQLRLLAGRADGEDTIVMPPVTDVMDAAELDDVPLMGGAR